MVEESPSQTPDAINAVGRFHEWADSLRTLALTQDEINMEWQFALNDILDNLNISDSELSRRLGYDRTYVGMLASSGRSIPREFVYRMSNYLKGETK